MSRSDLVGSRAAYARRGGSVPGAHCGWVISTTGWLEILCCSRPLGRTIHNPTSPPARCGTPSKAIQLPSGDQDGRNDRTSIGAAGSTRVTAPVAISTTKSRSSCLFGPLSAEKAMNRPSGDQVGGLSVEIQIRLVSLRTLRPSASATNNESGLSSPQNAMWVPSGDHVGLD